MVFSVSPSVIVREVDASTVIPAVATPPAAIAGVFRWGPVGERTFVTSEQELVERFGKPYANTGWQNYETFFTAADYLSYANALYVTRVVGTTANTAADGGDVTNVTAEFCAKYPGELGNSIDISYTNASGYEATMFLVSQANSNTAIEFNNNTISLDGVSTNSTVSVEPGDIIRIGNTSDGYVDMVVSTYTKTSYIDPGDGVTTLYNYDFTFTNRYTLAQTDPELLSFTKMWGYKNLASLPPATGNVHIAVIDRGGVITGTAGTLLELYRDVSTNPAARLDDGTTNYYRDVIENQSDWISTARFDTGADLTTVNTTTATSFYITLSGGADGGSEIDQSMFGRIAQGYDVYRDASAVDISALLTGKSLNSNLANYLVGNIAENRKDCVVFISPPLSAAVTPSNPADKLQAIIDFRGDGSTGIQSSSYWFMDSGYKYRYDKYNDLYRWVPLNGDMAGLCARVDPWVSPAGYKRGIIKNVVKLAFNPNKEQRDLLYGRDINPVITQVGQGVLLFGDKTGLGRPSAFDRINVRRLFITVEKAIATISASFLFDFNDEFTQTQFKNIVEPFLRDIQGKRGIIDFRVVSDGRVNTPDVIDRNIFRGNIFIKPARSINIIELTFVATRTGIEFDEIVGQPL
jgi:hypothetical protein